VKQTEKTYPQPCGCKYRFDDSKGLDGWILDRCAKHALPPRQPAPVVPLRQVQP
jgi:hypothetical protein